MKPGAIIRAVNTLLIAVLFLTNWNDTANLPFNLLLELVFFGAIAYAFARNEKLLEPRHGSGSWLARHNSILNWAAFAIISSLLILLELQKHCSFISWHVLGLALLALSIFIRQGGALDPDKRLKRDH